MLIAKVRFVKYLICMIFYCHLSVISCFGFSLGSQMPMPSLPFWGNPKVRCIEYSLQKYPKKIETKKWLGNICLPDDTFTLTLHNDSIIFAQRHDLFTLKKGGFAFRSNKSMSEEIEVHTGFGIITTCNAEFLYESLNENFAILKVFKGRVKLVRSDGIDNIYVYANEKLYAKREGNVLWTKKFELKKG